MLSKSTVQYQYRYYLSMKSDLTTLHYRVLVDVAKGVLKVSWLDNNSLGPNKIVRECDLQAHSKLVERRPSQSSEPILLSRTCLPRYSKEFTVIPTFAFTAVASCTA